jgi:cytoskeletal protein CcmA (bactofilin family)
MFGNRHEDAARLRAVDKSENPWEPTETFIDQGCELIGELRFEGAVRIDGRVEGTIRAAQGVIIGKTAEIDASIHAESVEVFGRVDGDLHVAHATLHQSARVDGEIQTAGIVVEDGAHFSGTIRIGAQDSTNAAQPDEPGSASEPAPTGNPDAPRAAEKTEKAA